MRERRFPIGQFPCGERNQITDVEGVSVGHCTVHAGRHHTGVTVIVPVPEDGTENVYEKKCVASCHIQNGFGKSTGLLQMEELGTLETPIALTNTLNVGKIWDAMLSHMITLENARDRRIYTLNPVVGECNDSVINEIQERVLGERELEEAFRRASRDFLEGDVGAGTGTICYGLKGGIGSSSRIVEIDGVNYTFGLLVQSNFGRTRNFLLEGRRLGEEIAERLPREAALDRGSIMMILATDFPSDHRQLKRICRRIPNGLSRTGSYTGHGSGEVVIGFTTGNRIADAEGLSSLCVFPDRKLDRVFRAMGELCEEAVLKSMYYAKGCSALDGGKIYSLKEFID